MSATSACFLGILTLTLRRCSRQPPSCELEEWVCPMISASHPGLLPPHSRCLPCQGPLAGLARMGSRSSLAPQMADGAAYKTPPRGTLSCVAVIALTSPYPLCQVALHTGWIGGENAFHIRRPQPIPKSFLQRQRWPLAGFRRSGVVLQRPRPGAKPGPDGQPQAGGHTPLSLIFFAPKMTTAARSSSQRHVAIGESCEDAFGALGGAGQGTPSTTAPIPQGSCHLSPVP